MLATITFQDTNVNITIDSKSHLGTPLATLTLRQQYNSQKVYKRPERYSIIVHVIIQPQAIYAGFT